MEIKLNKEQYNLLIKLLDYHDNLKNKILLKEDGFKFVIIIDEESADKIRDLAMDALQISGFDMDYNLTKEGVLMEDIIDAFYQ